MRSYEEIMADVKIATSKNDASTLLRLVDELDGLGTPIAIASAWRSRGSAAFMRGVHAEALGHHLHARSLFEALEDHKGIARSNNSIGITQFYLNDFAQATESLHRAYDQSLKIGDIEGICNIENHLAFVYGHMGDHPLALEHFHRSLSMCEQIGDLNGAAGAMSNIGGTLVNIGDYPGGLEYLHRALALLAGLGNKRYEAATLLNIGNVFDATGDYETALTHYRNALSIFQEIEDKSGIAAITTCIGWTYQNMGELTTALEYHHNARSLHLEIGALEAAANDLCNVILVSLEQNDNDAAQRHFADMDAITIIDPVLRTWREQCRAELQIRNGDADGAHTTLRNALDEALNHNLRSKAADVHKALRDLAQKRNDLAGYIEHNNEYTRINEEIRGKETSIKLAIQAKEREIAEREKETAKHLAVLHSTLPKHIADRVARGEVVNDHYDNASVIFLDIVGFTELSSSMSSQEVIALLDDIFTQCDAICAKHSVTKIKTIGDSYMCVAFESVINAALCAVEMSRISHSVSHPVSHEVEFRIGMHCGPVTAGVIGKERMQYDVWGDTVNIASRMESTGEPGRVQVSEAFALKLKSNTEYTIQNSMNESGNTESHEVPLVTPHSSLVTIDRGSIDVKGKGPMQTYWLERT
jgi:adenylate cyclase